MAWTEEQRLAKKEQMKAYHAKKKAAKEAVESASVNVSIAPEVVVGAVEQIEGFNEAVAQAQKEVAEVGPMYEESALFLDQVKPKNRLPETFKDMPSHLVERLKNQ